MKTAILIADVVAVCCPYCGEFQPNPVDGSEQWDNRHVASMNRMKCVSCDEEMRIMIARKVMFDKPQGA